MIYIVLFYDKIVQEKTVPLSAGVYYCNLVYFKAKDNNLIFKDNDLFGTLEKITWLLLKRIYMEN